ncbi:protein peste-like isoform X2 [Ischnura elegans]|uniref:protein peste-like isoform X2 n=1 Tax=Ischnura elegans TaxID=197161 RepID=UPI001ED8BB8F|nr:protein peste-like isoform X2 [Ischnura elegans]
MAMRGASGRRWCLWVAGSVLCALGAVSAFAWPHLFRYILHSQLQLSESSKSFEIWRDTPVPMSLTVYFFNWTNPNKLRTNEKPAFSEMGPYTFREFHEKVNLSFHENDTVTFQQVRTWKFDPSCSNGSLDDLVTTINVPPLRNGSSVYDGIFNMDTGHDDINKLGRLREWNYSNRTDFYEDQCGDIVGSAGELWPPGRTKDSISMFSSDLCRSIELPFASELELMGVPAYRFEGGPNLVDNGSLDAHNGCYCGGQCLPVGVVNASSCRYGSPAFVSFPHFLHADPYYASLIQGMSPDPKRHSFYITVEPKTGIPMDVAARLQINILMQPIKHVSMYEGVPMAFFPMIWFEQTATMTDEMASSLRLLLGVAKWGAPLCAATLVVPGLALLVLAARACSSARSHQTLEMKIHSLSDATRIMQPLVATDKRAKAALVSSPSQRRAPCAVQEDDDTDEFNSRVQH